MLEGLSGGGLFTVQPRANQAIPAENASLNMPLMFMFLS